MNSNQTGATPPFDASRTRHEPLADWSIVASHLIESSVIGDGAQMLDALCSGCVLPQVDLIGLWNDSSATDTEPVSDRA